MTSTEEALYPVVVQDRKSRQVLMLGYANQTALALTRETGLAHFYSRSRQRLWKKGETSGHVLPVEKILTDCDGDAFLYLADAENPVCHRNTPSCFGTGEAWNAAPLALVDNIVRERLSGAKDPASYTWSLIEGELARLIQKVGEEAVEVVIAACFADRSEDKDRGPLVAEIADLLYHLVVMMARLDVSLGDVANEFVQRHSGRRGGTAALTNPD